MKSLFNGVAVSPIESIPFNHGEIEAQKAIRDVFDNLDEDIDVKYNPEFIEEMNEIKKEEPITVAKYEDLFDDE
ncbi:DUF2683 family protein [Methanobrevibacter sp.]|uniref:DUF2683 family protein n=1 Tax=Methanobrevibacter sp. TaxID=66852 RepID=UPI00388DFA09